MDNLKRLATLPEEKYQIVFGVKKVTFEKMLKILENANKELRKFGGRPSRLSVLDKLIVMLGYYHDYRTMENISFDYGVSKSRISDAVKWVEQTLIKDGTFSLPSKRELVKENSTVSIAIIDVTECETERPKHNQKASYSGKKKTYNKRSADNKWRKWSNYRCL
jgi:predicted DNA-binding protein YlxM (UPF0122 family)